MYCAYITTIKELRKHSNADRLQCATIFGNNVIVDMSYKAGDRVVYFPVDGQLDYAFADDNKLIRKKDADGNNIGGYLDPDKRNITALKLRGEKSDGLVLPISVLNKYTDVEKLKDGDQISEFNGIVLCKKYIPKRQHSQRTRSSEKKSVNKKELKKVMCYEVEKSGQKYIFNVIATKDTDKIKCEVIVSKENEPRACTWDKTTQSKDNLNFTNYNVAGCADYIVDTYAYEIIDFFEEKTDCMYSYDRVKRRL